MKIALLTRYSQLGASSRLRSLQYLPRLRKEGLDVTVLPFFDDNYIRGLYSTGQRGRLKSLKFYAARVAQSMSFRHFDLFWIEKEAMPWVPWALERLILPRNIPYLVDYDDAVFHRYDYDSKGLVRLLLHDKIDQVMKHAACVTVGNRYLESRAIAAGSPRIERIPTVVDLDKYSVRADQGIPADLRVGWIGTPKTWRSSARPIYESLLDSLAPVKAKFRAIGASLEPVFEGTFENVPWAEDDEVSLIQSLDIGIMPLQDDPWTRGKCGYKLIQYMACGIPVVASPIGVNTEIVSHGVNGFLASNEDEWKQCVSRLLSDPKLRKEMGMRGRHQVEERFSLEVWAPKVAGILRTLL